MANSLGSMTLLSSVSSFSTSASVSGFGTDTVSIVNKKGGINTITGDFTVGDEVLLHVVKSAIIANMSSFEFFEIIEIAGSTIKFNKDIPALFKNSTCQLVKVATFTNFKINSGVNVSTFNFDSNGNGGLIVIRASGTCTIDGTLTVSGLGYPPDYSFPFPLNGTDVRDNVNSNYWAGSGGTGRVQGGNAGSTGGDGYSVGGGNRPRPVIMSDPDILKNKKLQFGGAGGYGYYSHSYIYSTSNTGGAGGGGIIIIANEIVINASGRISANGLGGRFGYVNGHSGGAGGGAGGSIILNAPSIVSYYQHFAGCTGGGGAGTAYSNSLSNTVGGDGFNNISGQGGASEPNPTRQQTPNAIGSGGNGHSYSIYSVAGHGTNGNQPPGGGGGGYGFLAVYTLSEINPVPLTPMFKSGPIFFKLSFEIPYPDFPEKVENIILLREKTNEFRTNNGLPPITNWTENVLIRNVTPIRAVHWNEITQGILDTYTLLNIPFAKQEVEDIIKEKVLPNYDKHKISDLKNRLFRIAEALKN